MLVQFLWIYSLLFGLCQLLFHHALAGKKCPSTKGRGISFLRLFAMPLDAQKGGHLMLISSPHCSFLLNLSLDHGSWDHLSTVHYYEPQQAFLNGGWLFNLISIMHFLPAFRFLITVPPTSAGGWVGTERAQRTVTWCRIPETEAESIIRLMLRRFVTSGRICLCYPMPSCPLASLSSFLLNLLSWHPFHHEYSFAKPSYVLFGYYLHDSTD